MPTSRLASGHPDQPTARLLDVAKAKPSTSAMPAPPNHQNPADGRWPIHQLARPAVSRGNTPVMTEACQAGTCRTAQPMHAGKTMTPPSTTPISQGHSARDGRRERTHPR